MNTTERFYQLDGIKGIASFFIIFVHYYGRMGGGEFPLAFLPSLFVEHGDSFVDLFFIMSGFVFAYTHKTRAGEVSLKDYAIARFKRLYFPVFYAVWLDVLVRVFAMCVLRVSSRLTVQSLIETLLFADTLLYNHEPFPTVVWYVHVLALCYMAYYLVLRSKTETRYVIAVFAMFVAGWILYIQRISFPLLYRNIGRGLFSFSIGLLINEFQSKVRESTRIKVSVTCMGVAFILLVLGKLTSLTYVFGDFLFCLKVLIFPTVVIVALNCEFAKKALLFSPLLYLGKISMAVYLVHVPVLNFIGVFLNPEYGIAYVANGPIRFDTLSGFIIIMITIFITAIVWHYIVNERLVKATNKAIGL